MPDFPDEFSKQAATYAEFRPTYPEALYEFLLSVVPSREAAWDAGTGNGQCAVALARHFARVFATDASPEQIAHAKAAANVSYGVATAEDSGLPSSSVDLVSAAQCAHWFDMARFVAEVRRVLHTNGVIAIWGYGFHSSRDPQLDAIMNEFGMEILGPYWPRQNRLLLNAYAELRFPFAPIAHPNFTIEVNWSLPELVGYYNSWSATQRFIATNGDHPLRHIYDRLACAWGPAESKRTLIFELAMKVGRAA